jgi:hypothetical protein
METQVDVPGAPNVSGPPMQLTTPCACGVCACNHPGLAALVICPKLVCAFPSLPRRRLP